MSNGHLVLILAIVIVSVMVNKNTTAHEICKTYDLEASAAGPADVECRLQSETLIPNEE